jgi:hypothetical protein
MAHRSRSPTTSSRSSAPTAVTPSPPTKASGEWRVARGEWRAAGHHSPLATTWRAGRPPVCCRAVLVDRDGPPHVRQHAQRPLQGRRLLQLSHGGIRLKVFACAVHARCTTDTPLPTVACCRHCPDYQERDGDFVGLSRRCRRKASKADMTCGGCVYWRQGAVQVIWRLLHKDLRLPYFAPLPTPRNPNCPALPPEARKSGTSLVK